MRASDVTFEQLGLRPELTQALSEAGYREPTPIQRDAIPSALKKRDIIGCAQTGTGKTAAFALPVLQRIDSLATDKPTIRALILSPTRELAAQIGESFSVYGRHLDLWHTVVFGGVPENKQIAILRKGVDILVATPGRLLDLMAQGYIRLGQVDLFVLDEADQMLDMGFLPSIRKVVAALPKNRQTLFFSATMPTTIRELAQQLVHDPVTVSVSRVSTPAEGIDQRLYFVDTKKKKELLFSLLKDKSIQRTLVFSRTKHGANRIAEALDKKGITAAAIHGNKSQSARTRALEGFRNGKVRVLVATDIAARGIDIDGVSHVINYDLPNIPETHVHRIGRTARAGASGVALSFCSCEEFEFLEDIERLMAKHIPRVEDHPYLPNGEIPAPTDLDKKRRPASSTLRPAKKRTRSSSSRRSNSRHASGHRSKKNGSPKNSSTRGSENRGKSRSSSKNLSPVAPG